MSGATAAGGSQKIKISDLQDDEPIEDEAFDDIDEQVTDLSQQMQESNIESSNAAQANGTHEVTADQQAAAQNARDLCIRGNQALEQGDLQAAHQCYCHAEQAYMALGDMNFASQIANSRMQIEAKWQQTRTASVSGPPGQETCGIGLSFHPDDSGQFKITNMRAGSPAANSGQLQIGDILLKVDGVAVYGKSVSQIIDMIVGPPNTFVSLTIQAQYGFPHVMTAPFQELPFDIKKDKRKGRKDKKGADGLKPENKLFGGGTLPPGFEHLESLRSAQPYTTPSLSVRTISIQRQLPARRTSQLDSSAGSPSTPQAAGREAALPQNANGANAAGPGADGRWRA